MRLFLWARPRSLAYRQTIPILTTFIQYYISFFSLSLSFFLPSFYFLFFVVHLSWRFFLNFSLFFSSSSPSPSFALFAVSFLHLFRLYSSMYPMRALLSFDYLFRPSLCPVCVCVNVAFCLLCSLRFEKFFRQGYTERRGRREKETHLHAHTHTHTEHI